MTEISKAEEFATGWKAQDQCARLIGRFGRLFDQRRDLFRMRQKNRMAAGELDCFGLRPAAHESLELGVDLAILGRDNRVALLL